MKYVFVYIENNFSNNINLNLQFGDSKMATITIRKHYRYW